MDMKRNIMKLLSIKKNALKMHEKIIMIKVTSITRQ
jgi:hypothetical protein